MVTVHRILPQSDKETIVLYNEVLKVKVTQLVLQWNLSITDTLGTTKSVQYKEVSLLQRLLHTHLSQLGPKPVSTI